MATAASNPWETASADESRLIAECLRGRPDAFGALVLRYQDQLFNTVYRLLDNAEDARDVVQDAFLLAYQSLPKFQGEARFSTWLYRIAVNAAISHRRRHKSRPGPRGAQPVPEPFDRSEGSQPEKALEQGERERRIQEALNRMSPEHRIVLVLKEIEGRKYEAIAEVLQVPIGTVRSRLHRARLELRDLLSEE